MVALMGGVIDEGLDPHDIELPVIAEHLFIRLDINNFSDELGMNSYFQSVKQTAFQYYRKLSGIRCIYYFASDRGQTGTGKLVHVTPGDNPGIISFCHPAFAGYADGKGFTLSDVVIRISRPAQRYGYAGWIRAADASPGGVHQVWLARLPTIKTGAGKKSVFAPSDFFIVPPCGPYAQWLVDAIVGTVLECEFTLF